MFYKADSTIFERAKHLRSNLTDAERKLWGYLNRSQLGVRFKCQHPLSCYIADFYCHSLKLVIEVDGEIHLVDEIQNNDRTREEAINELGVTIIRFSNKQVLNKIEHVLEEIRSRIKISAKY